MSTTDVSIADLVVPNIPIDFSILEMISEPLSKTRSAEAWQGGGNPFFDEFLQRVFDLGYFFSEGRERFVHQVYDELILNAVRHGSQYSPEKAVEVTFYFGRNVVYLHCRQEQGFDHGGKMQGLRKKIKQGKIFLDENRIAVQIDDQGVQSEGGTGLCIVQLCDGYLYNPTGTEVAVEIHMGAEAEKRFQERCARLGCPDSFKYQPSKTL